MSVLETLTNGHRHTFFLILSKCGINNFVLSSSQFLTSTDLHSACLRLGYLPVPFLPLSPLPFSP